MTIKVIGQTSQRLSEKKRKINVNYFCFSVPDGVIED